MYKTIYHFIYYSFSLDVILFVLIYLVFVLCDKIIIAINDTIIILQLEL